MCPTGSDVVIREATLDDSEGLVALLNPIIDARIYTAMVDRCTVESQRAYLEAFPSRGVFHVAEARTERRILGCQDVVPFYADSAAFNHVGSIATFVDLAHHRQGVAARLFDATFEAAAGKGYEKILAWVRADNEAGLRAYRGQGFEEVGTASRLAKIDGRYVDEIIFERSLPTG